MSRDLPGLPFGPVDAWLGMHLPEIFSDSSWQASLISGGLSNITYRLRASDGTTVILRRPPLGGVLPSAHDMVREHRVLTALGETDVPVPRTLALCTDAEVLGRSFYVMSDVAGQVLSTREDTAALTPEQRAELSEELISTLAALHAVDFSSVGLADYGRPEGYTARQIRRWGEQWARSRTRDLPDMERLLERLAADVPEQAAHSLVHGDYRLDNTIVDVPRILAVIDWELSTLGDPLADLGLALTYWHDLGDTERELIPVAVGVTAHEGFPTRRRLAERYAELTGRDLSRLPFYQAMGSMKLAVILEGVRARHAGGHTVSEGYDGVGDPVPALVAAGLREHGSAP